jgi:hypothetical protein
VDQVVAALNYLSAHWVAILVGAAAVSGVFSQIAAVTPWTWDDGVAGALAKVLQAIAGNWGNQASKGATSALLGGPPAPPMPPPGKIRFDLLLPLALLAVLAFLTVTGCATPPPSVTNTVYTSEATLAALETGMATYCERADRDANVCSAAREYDAIAHDSIAAADAAVQAGKDPTQALAAAKLATDALAGVFAKVK